MLEDDGYGKLGLYSNAILYLGVGLGCLFSTGVLNSIGVIKSMVVGSFLCVPFIAAFLPPALKVDYY